MVAQAFQPVRINEAGEDVRPTTFHNLLVGRRPMDGFTEKFTPHRLESLRYH